MNRREVLAGLLAAAAFGPDACGTAFAEAQQENASFDPRTPRPLRSPTLREFRAIAEDYGLELTDSELNVYLERMKPQLASLRKLEQMAEPTLPVKYPRTPGYRPKREDNPLNAWFWKCSIKGASSGLLAGKKVVVKDTYCVAGLPLTNGSSVLDGFVPNVDATVVTRILDAGGEIVGKSVCEAFSFSGGSHTSDTGPVVNPHDRTRSAGGSSSGSGALVAAGEVDIATGGDQGGSIRIPSSWCGIFGLKPTYGLVPYTGIFPGEMTIDHTGPMARTVEDCALLLESVAGPDGFDPRQWERREGETYSQMLTGDARGLRCGVLKEGFGRPEGETDVDNLVREAAERLTRTGASVTEVSVPMHLEAAAIWSGLNAGVLHLMESGAVGTNWQGFYLTQLVDALGARMKERANDWPPNVKGYMLGARWVRDNYHGRHYAKMQNMRGVLRDAYNHAFDEVDLLVLPTIPMKATPIPPPDADLNQVVERAEEMSGNTYPFNLSGHPAMNVPCGMSEGLPVGMMLVGRHGEDGTVLRAAHAFEQLG